MSTAWTKCRLVIALGAALSAAGCGTPAGAILQPGPESPRWPAAPDQARIVYLGELRTDQDLKPARSALQGLSNSLFGEEPARGMTTPMGVCTDGSLVFIADSGARTLHVFDLDTRAYAVWNPPKDPFELPVAVACGPAGRVLVADAARACLIEFDHSGAFVGRVGEGALKRPCGVAVATDGRVFVADVGAHQVVILSPRGEELGRLGERGSGRGQFNFPTNLVFDHAGRLYVSDTLNFRIQVFSPQLAPIGELGRKGDLPGTFSQPKGVAVDADDHLYVVDANFEALQLFDADGALLMSLGKEGRGPGEFWLPAGIHVDPSGRVWVADSYNQRVQVFQYLGEGVRP